MQLQAYQCERILQLCQQQCIDVQVTGEVIINVR